MSVGDGSSPPGTAEKTLGEIVSDVSEKASLLVREEVQLAKAEVQDKVSKLAKGAAVAAAAGVFVLFAAMALLHAVAWLINDALDTTVVWPGYAIVFAILIVLGALAALVAVRAFKQGAPPTPDLAIEEAKRTRAELEHQRIERDQVKRTLEKGEELTS